MMLRRKTRRVGSVLIESALVYPVLFLVVLGIILMGLAVFRYQQVSHMAREGARYAIVHGAKYSDVSEASPARSAIADTDIYENAIKPHAAGMQLSGLSYTITWTDSNKQTSSTVQTVNGTPTVVTKANTVSVYVRYEWQLPLFGTIPVSSTSVMTMSY
jgi:Flp pilus assembly protein TadG